MALTDEVQNRYGTQYLIELTNPANSGEITIDTDRLDNSIKDVQAFFEIYAGVVYDNDNSHHVATGVEGVETFLIMYKSRAADRRNKLRNEFIERLKDMSKVGARDKVTPTTSSELTPSDENPHNKTVRPLFDDQRMRGYVPDSDFRDELNDNR